jgi:hypothetical protein
MGAIMYVKLKNLHPAIQNQLKRRGYNGKDISIEPREKYSLGCSGGDGQRSYTDVLNLSDFSIAEHTGSWGGANIFNPANKVDLDFTGHELTETTVVIRGHEGHKPYASLLVHPSTIDNYKGDVIEVTMEEKEVLSIFCMYKSSYRAEYLNRKRFDTNAVTESLVTKKLLKRNAAGAISLTTEGRNAAR